jgi:hypothetical protein
MTHALIRRLALAAGPLIVLAACNGADMGMEAAGDPVLGAALTGAAEAPGPGDAGGRAVVRFDAAMPTRLCYELTVTNIATASAAHIHRGAAGVAGPVAVPLSAPTGGSSSGCVGVAAPLAAEIMAAPGGFYVNVHNADFPNGAVRGQLAG